MSEPSLLEANGNLRKRPLLRATSNAQWEYVPAANGRRADHTEPLYLRSVLPPPTAQTLAASLPHMANRFASVPLDCADYAEPSYLRMFPLSPTAQTSLASRPHTPRSGRVGQ